MREKIVFLAYMAGWKLVGVLPEKVAYALFRKLGEFFYSRNGKGVRRLRTNLSIVKPQLTATELESLTHDAFLSYMRYWCDTFRIHKWSHAKIEASVSTTDDHLLRDPMRDGRGVVIALPHSGNWDHAGAYFCQQGINLVTVAEVLKPEALFKKFLEHRTRMGFEVLALDSRAFVTLIKRAREKRLIALVSDRDLSASGIEVNFFGHRTKMPGGPALLALREGLPLVVAHVSYTRNGIHIDFREVEISTAPSDDLRLQETVQKMATAFEVGISEHPVDWHMLQRIWIEEGIY